MRLIVSIMNANTFHLCVVGHSLVPSTVQLTDLPGVRVTVLRFPGATVDSLTNQLTFLRFWVR